MGIFHLLKSCEHPVALKALNEYLKYSAKLAEAKTNVDFIRNCIENNQYPKSFSKSLRRCKVRPNTKSLKRFALNQIESLQGHISTLERNIPQRQYAVDELPTHLKELFLKYVHDVSKTRETKKRIQLTKGLDTEIPESHFPKDPERLHSPFVWKCM
uniref:Uncharacterized protein n=1 Tax=Trichobilharzia regenti TaxID=157069 RepID=A0AA85KEM7_TRIRE|nr:unnamed protein product [Trichobilharzia regenti]